MKLLNKKADLSSFALQSGWLQVLSGVHTAVRTFRVRAFAEETPSVLQAGANVPASLPGL